MEELDRCRVCLNDVQHPPVPLDFKPDGILSIADLITSVSGVVISNEDSFPKFCCESCSERLLSAYNLAKQCRESDEKLRAAYKEQLLGSTSGDDGSSSLEGENSDEGNTDHEADVELPDIVGLTTCCACRTDYETVEAFAQHIAKVHEPERTDDHIKKPFQCDVCFKRYFKKTSLNRHKRMGAAGPKIRTLKDEEPTDHRCCGCRKDFATAEDLREHSNREHASERVVDETKPYECEICFKRYLNKTSLSRHFRERLLEKRPGIVRKLVANQCCGCREKFGSKDQLEIHSKAVHEPDRREDLDGLKPYECGTCFSRYSSQGAYDRHKNYIFMDQLYKCHQCDKSFVKRIMLRSHERKFHNGLQNEVIGPYQCSHCGKTFMQPSSLTNHEKIHTENRRFECSICQKAFLSKGNLQTHLKLHEPESQKRKPQYECRICRCRFKTPNYLEIHSRVHTGEKPYQCKYCSKQFAHASGHKRHLLTHSSLKPFVCRFCNRGFALRPNMLIHEKSHGSDQSVKCDICGKGFVHERYMRKHRKRHLC